MMILNLIAFCETLECSETQKKRMRHHWGKYYLTHNKINCSPAFYAFIGAVNLFFYLRVYKIVIGMNKYQCTDMGGTI